MSELPPFSAKGILASLAILIVGIVCIFIGATADVARNMDAPWNLACVFLKPMDVPPDADPRPVAARLVQRDEILEGDDVLKAVGQMLAWEEDGGQVSLSDPELLIALDIGEEEIAPLLESGRLPTPGAPEVLAGDLARDADFFVDGVRFSVVGRLKPTVSGFVFAYMLPHRSDFKALFTEDTGASQGILVVEGARLMDSGQFPGMEDDPFGTGFGGSGSQEEGVDIFLEDHIANTPVLPTSLGGITRTASWIAMITLVGALLAALGGSLFHYCLFSQMHRRGTCLFAPVYREVARHRWMFLGMHALLYGAFFAAIYVAMENPLLAFRLKQYIIAVFSGGGLDYIGDAYDSGNVLNAAWTTFYNNYVEQTLLMTFAVSLFPIPLGIIKTLLSFLLVGGAMAPLWTGSAQLLVLHCITMAVELEAYIIACFAITLWPAILVYGLWSGHFLASVKRGLWLLVNAALLTGVMLALVAFYEALTLIHMV